MQIIHSLLSVGDVVEHELFGYRGVVFDIDPHFMLDDDWYEQMARSRPPKDRPWYHVLVHDTDTTTYVAQRNLRRQEPPQEVKHPLLGHFFSHFSSTHGYRPADLPH